MKEDNIEILGLGSKQFLQVPYTLIDNEQIGVAEKGLYIILCRYKNKVTKKSYPSLSTLEKKTGMTKKTILAKIKLLEEIGLLKKINNQSETLQNNTYILFDPEVVFGYRQLKMTEMTDEELEALSSIDQKTIIQKNDKAKTVIVCSSEKNAFFLRSFYNRLQIFAESLMKDTNYAMTSVIIGEIEKFYESIAMSKVIFLEDKVNEESSKVSSEDYLELIQYFNLDEVVDLVRQVEYNGIPDEYKMLGKYSYIMNRLWQQKMNLIQTEYSENVKSILSRIKAIKG